MVTPVMLLCVLSCFFLLAGEELYVCVCVCVCVCVFIFDNFTKLSQ